MTETAKTGSNKLPAGESNAPDQKVRRQSIEKSETKALKEALGVDGQKLKQLKKKLAKIEGVPERGIETLFRLTSKNHYTLKRMVDTKASFLLSINAIIISVLIGTIVPDLDNDPHLLVPTIMLLASSLLSIAYGVVSARPDRVRGFWRGTPARPNSDSPIHFTTFFAEDRDAFRRKMLGLMEDRTALYDSLIDDLYYLGRELYRKYHYIRAAFTVFLWGLIASVLTFMLCHIFFAA